MSNLEFWGGLSCLPFIGLLACGNGTVDLGSGRLSREAFRNSRCSDSSSVSGSVRVHDQSELEALAGCEQIDGDLHVEIYAGADLSALSSLRVVNGELELGAYPDFPPDIEPEQLQALRARVNQTVAAGYLSSLAGLEGLQQVGSLDISSIAAADLEPLRGLHRLIGPEGSLPTGLVGVQSAPNLQDLRGLSNIEAIDQLDLVDDPVLTSLGGIVMSPTVVNVNLVDVPQLGSIEELGPLASAVTLYLSNTGVTHLDSLVNLGIVEDGIAITGNRKLVDVDLLGVMSTASLLVRDNAVLQSIPRLAGMWGLEVFSALDNPQLQTLDINVPAHTVGPDDFEGKALVDPVKAFEIAGNAQLTRISLTDGLESARLLAIHDNPSLTSISLGTLTRLEQLDIDDNRSLTSVDVGALRTVETLSVVANPKLDTTSLGGLRTFDSTLVEDAAAPE
jgi:hypothetical protein